MPSYRYFRDSSDCVSQKAARNSKERRKLDWDEGMTRGEMVMNDDELMSSQNAWIGRLATRQAALPTNCLYRTLLPLARCADLSLVPPRDPGDRACNLASA